MSDEDEDEDVGLKLDGIRARKKVADEDEDSDDDEQVRPINLEEEIRKQEIRAKYSKKRIQAGRAQKPPPPLLISSQQSSQASSTASIHYWQPSPSALSQVARAPILPWEQFVQPKPPSPLPDYQDDPFSPFAPGGIMSKPPAPLLAPLTRAFLPPVAPSPILGTAIRNKKPPTSGRKSSKSPPPARDTEEEKRLQQEIEMVVNNFQPDYKNRIECEEERDIKNLEDQELHLVARWLNVNKPTPHKLDLATFNSKQIRKLAQNCGVKGGGNLTLFQARRKIAMSITMGIVYNDNTIANPKTTGSK